MRPWAFLAPTPSNAEPASDLPVSEPASASTAGASLETWSPDFKSLSMYEQIFELHDHIVKVVATIATMRAEQQERDERIDKLLGLGDRDFLDRGESTGDMTGQQK